MSGGETWKGAKSLSNKITIRMRSAQVLLRYFFVYFGVFFIVFSVLSSTHNETDNTLAWAYSKYLSNTGILPIQPLKIYTKENTRIALSYADIIKHKDVLSDKNHFLTKILLSFIAAIIVSIFLLKLTRKFFLKVQSQGNKSTKLVRGGIILSQEDLTGYLVENGQDSPYHIGNLPIRKNAETQHIFISGAVGGGKGNAIKSLLDDIDHEKKRFFVYDKSGEYVKKYYRDGYDIILNPFDERMPFWSPWLEADSIFDYDHLATSFVPDAPNEKAHWVDAPRTVLSDLLAVLAQKNKKDVGFLFEQFQDKNKLYELLQDTSSGNVIDPDAIDHAASVIGVLAPKVKSLRLLSGIKNSPFSLREWVRNEQDDRRVFFTANERQLHSVKPLISAWIDIIISEVLSLPEDRNKRLFGIVDELASLNAINSIKTGIFEGRKYGLSLILSVTSIEILRSVYGKQVAAAMIAMCNTKVTFRCDESDVAKWLADLYLEEDIYETKEGTTLSDNHDSFNTHEDRHKRHLVLPTEFMQLNDMDGYVKLGGNLPISKVHVPYIKRPTIAQVYMKRPMNIYAKKTDNNTEQLESESAYDFADSMAQYNDFIAAGMVDNKSQEKNTTKAGQKRKPLL